MWGFLYSICIIKTVLQQIVKIISCCIWKEHFLEQTLSRREREISSFNEVALTGGTFLPHLSPKCSFTSPQLITVLLLTSRTRLIQILTLVYLLEHLRVNEMLRTGSNTGYTETRAVDQILKATGTHTLNNRSERCTV